MPTFRLATALPTTAEALFAWHERPGAFDRLNPPWDPVRVLSRTGRGLEVGVTLSLEARFGPTALRWTTAHTACERPAGFTDEQTSGPFAVWRHQHRFLDQEGGGAVLEDLIDWEPPLGGLGRAVAAGAIGDRIGRAFRFRHRRTRDDLARHAPFRDRPRLKVLVAGASGLVGTALCAFLDAGGHEVVRLGRRGPGPTWDPGAGRLDSAALDGVDAVVSLQGAPIAEGAWTDERRAEIRSSRVDGTALLARAMAGRADRPRVWVSGSAVGIYGDGGEAELDESAPAGAGFLAEVGREWEAATAPAEAAGVRVVRLRTGLVLSAAGGLLGALLPVFRAGGGGPVGPGTQHQPWIHLDDLIGAIHHALWDEALTGPLNGVGPAPCPQRDFARTLARVVGRPALVPAPAFAMRAALGRQKADELILAGQRAVPRRLQQAGFRFLFPELEGALRFELGQTAADPSVGA